MTSSWRHIGVYSIAINKVLMFYLTSKFHDDSVNTFGFIMEGGFEAPPPAQGLRKAQAE